LGEETDEGGPHSPSNCGLASAALQAKHAILGTKKII